MSFKQLTCSFSSLFFLTFCAGCIILPVSYYRPMGEVDISTGSQFVYWCADRLYVRKGDGVVLWVKAVPHGHGTRLHVSINIDQDKKWFELATDEVELSEPETGLRRKEKILALRKSFKLQKEVGYKEFYDARERIELTSTSPFELDMEFHDFRPLAFTLQMPALIVAGQRVDIAPIAFQHKRGARLYTGGQ